jgi:hypothetical protein
METMETARRVTELKSRADEDAVVGAPDVHDPNRHRADLEELGLRVSLTRARYPNRPDGVEMYALTLSRLDLRTAPTGGEVQLVLTTAFGDAAAAAIERPGGPLVRMFRVPVS